MKHEKGLWIYLNYSFVEYLKLFIYWVPTLLHMGKIMENMALALMEFRLGKILIR